MVELFPIVEIELEVAADLSMLMSIIEMADKFDVQLAEDSWLLRDNPSGGYILHFTLCGFEEFEDAESMVDMIREGDGTWADEFTTKQLLDYSPVPLATLLGTIYKRYRGDKE